MKKTSFLIILISLLSCNSKIEYEEKNLSEDTDLVFLLQESDYLRGQHDYDNNNIEFELKLTTTSEMYFNKVIRKAKDADWQIIHKDNSILILYKIIDNNPIIIKVSNTGMFVFVKIE